MLCTAEIAPLLNRTSCSKNNLGFALFTLLIMDPSSISSLGFTFSYGTTAALLFGYPLVKKYVSLWIADRPLEEALKMSFLDKHLLIILMTFRNGLSLSLAVSLVALPLSLYYFHSFPLLSLFYNIFYPPLICITLIFLLLALLFCLTPVGTLFFYLAEATATTSINLLTSFSPPFFFFIYVKKIAIIPLLIYFTSLFFLLLKTIDQKEEFKRSF
jgi:competence protein ComEC